MEIPCLPHHPSTYLIYQMKSTTNVISVDSSSLLLFYHLQVLIHTVPVHPHSLAILHGFLEAIHNYVSEAVWKRINKMVCRINHRSTQIVSMQSSLGLLNPEVSSLAQLAKITMRTSFQGTVIQKVDLLSVPEKIKAYLLSED